MSGEASHIESAGGMTAGQGGRGLGYAWYMVAVIVCLVILSYIDRAVLSLFAHPIQASLGLSDSQMGLLFGLGFIAPLALATIAVGWAIDHYNRVAIILAGVVLWSLATALSGLAGGFGALLAARGLMGLGEASIGPAGYALVADRFPPEKRGRAMGVIAASVSVGTGAALIVGGLLLQALGENSYTLPLVGSADPWQVAYLLLGAVGIPAALAVLTLRDGRRNGARGGKERKAGADWSFLRGRGGLYGALFACAALNVALGTGVVAWSPTWMIRRFGLEPSDAGYILGLMSILGGVVGPPLAAELSDRWLRAGHARGRMRGHPVLFAAMGAGVAILALAPNLYLAASGLLLVTLSLGALNALSYAAIPDLTPRPMTGRMLAALQFLSLACGYGAGPSLVAAFTDHVFGDRAMLGAALLAASLPICIAGILLSHGASAHYAAARASVQREGGDRRGGVIPH